MAKNSGICAAHTCIPQYREYPPPVVGGQRDHPWMFRAIKGTFTIEGGGQSPRTKL